MVVGAIGRGRVGCWVVFLALSSSAFAQKIKVGYDKGADFSQYKSYILAEPTTTPARPLLYQNIAGAIDSQLQSRNILENKSDPDLILVPKGGFEIGINQPASIPILPTYSGPPPYWDANMWTGAAGPVSLMAPYVPEGSLELTFVDRRSHKIVWSGTVTQKLDADNKSESLKRINQAIAKLLSEFPPKKK